MLSVGELVSLLQLYLSLMLLYHLARPILHYVISLLITALHLFLKLLFTPIIDSLTQFDVSLLN